MGHLAVEHDKFLARRQTKAKRRLIQAQREFKELKATARMQEDAASESYSIGGTELSAGVSLQEPARNTRTGSHRRVVSDGMDASQHSAMMMQQAHLHAHAHAQQEAQAYWEAQAMTAEYPAHFGLGLGLDGGVAPMPMHGLDAGYPVHGQDESRFAHYTHAQQLHDEHVMAGLPLAAGALPHEYPRALEQDPEARVLQAQAFALKQARAHAHADAASRSPSVASSYDAGYSGMKWFLSDAQEQSLGRGRQQTISTQPQAAFRPSSVPPATAPWR